MSAPAKRVIRDLDKFGLCHLCNSDEHVEIVPADLGITWQDCGCTARVRVCYPCKAMASEPCPHGQELRSELAPKRGKAISLPGRPTRPLELDTLHRPGPLQRVLERAKLPRIH